MYRGKFLALLRGAFPRTTTGGHNVYGPDTVATEVEPVRPTVVVPPTWLYVPLGDTEARQAQTWAEGQYGRLGGRGERWYSLVGPS